MRRDVARSRPSKRTHSIVREHIKGTYAVREHILWEENTFYKAKRGCEVQICECVRVCACVCVVVCVYAHIHTHTCISREQVGGLQLSVCLSGCAWLCLSICMLRVELKNVFSLSYSRSLALECVHSKKCVLFVKECVLFVLLAFSCSRVRSLICCMRLMRLKPGP